MGPPLSSLVFACHGRKVAHNSPSGSPCHGQEKSKVQLGQCSAVLETYPSKQGHGTVVKEGKMQIFGVNDKVYFNAVNGEGFLALQEVRTKSTKQCTNITIRGQ